MRSEAHRGGPGRPDGPVSEPELLSRSHFRLRRGHTHDTVNRPARRRETMIGMNAPATFYDEIGGHPTFVALVGGFYRRVADDPVLRPLYPEDDLGPAEIRFRMFLEQYWGGPRTYSDQRGHPRLRMRHLPFVIGVAERDAWLARCARASTTWR